MSQKSTRGVQQEEVFAAADALLAEQLRPTIERVRLKIGRGSPNTVAPMLESWFASLGVRLGVAPTAPGEGGAPAPVRSAMDGVWAAALEAAREQADIATAADREAVARERKAVCSEREELARQRAATTERVAALQESLATARRQAEEQGARVSDLLAKLQSLEGELTASRSSVGRLVDERQADRMRFDEQLAAQGVERRRIEERADGAERRLLGEVDRARLEAKHHLARMEQTQRDHQAAQAVAAQSYDELARKYREAEIRLASLQEQVASSERRESDLRKQLQVQRAATEAAITRGASNAPKKRPARQPSASAERSKKAPRKRAAAAN